MTKFVGLNTVQFPASDLMVSAAAAAAASDTNTKFDQIDLINGKLMIISFLFKRRLILIFAFIIK